MSDSKRKRHNKARELAGNLSKDELLRRLKTLCEELANVDQDENTVNYDDVASRLASDFLLKHKDKDVKACVACCYADILRIYAPEPPYNPDQLKSIFNLMVAQLKNLEDPEGSLFKRAYYLLESLGMVKSFNICCEIDAQEIIVKLFKTFFNLINEKHNIKVKTIILDVLASIIQDTDSLSLEVLDELLINIIEPRQSSKPSAYQLASSLIDRCSTTLEPYLQVFFNDNLVLNKETGSVLENHVYDLILQLNKINKTILLSVLPQLEFKLKSVEETERLDAVRVLSIMFSEEDSDLAILNKTLWNNFLGRFVDVSVDVRTECVLLAKDFLISKPDLIDDITDCVKQRCHDIEEKVRLQAVVSVCEAAAEKMENIPQVLLDAVKERMRDKKWPVRKAALTCIAKLYKAIKMGQNIDASSVEKISWVPDNVLQIYYQNFIEDKLCVERIVHGCLVPVTLEPEEKMEVLYKLYASLNNPALKAFDILLRNRSMINNELKQLLDVYSNECGDKEKLLFHQILKLAKNLPEHIKAQDNLKKFTAMLGDAKLFDLLETSTNINSGCDAIRKAVAEIVKMNLKNPVIVTVKAMLDRTCHMLVDSQSLLILLKHVKKSIDGMDDDDDDYDEDQSEDEVQLSQKAKRGLLLLKCLATVLPEIFKTKECYEQLLQLIKHQDDFVVETSLRILCHVGDELEIFDRSLCSCFQPVLSQIATRGTRKQGQFAIRCLFKILKDSSVVMDRLLNSLFDSLKYDSPVLLTTLASLAEIALDAPRVFEAKHKEIVVEFVVKNLMSSDREDAAIPEDSDEWAEDDEISHEAQLKIQGIKLLVKWLLGLQSNQRNSAVPVFRMLDKMLKNNGDLNGNGKTSTKDKTRLRLAAAKGMINLVQDSNYADVITREQYQQLALTMKDSCYDVREKFAFKIHSGLGTLKLPLDYLAFFMLSATDQTKERKIQARQIIAKNATQRREYMKHNSQTAALQYTMLPEYSLPYAIYLMSHYPGFDQKKADSVNEAREHLWFFLEPLLGQKGDKASFLKKMTENIKQLRDAACPEDESQNEKLYVVCDLVIWLLTNKTHTVFLKEFQGSPVLPKKLFQPSAKKMKPNTKNYLPIGFHASPRGKKPIPIDVRVTSTKVKTPVKSKVTPNKRTMRVRTKESVTKTADLETETPSKYDTSRDAELSGEEESDIVSDASGDEKAPMPAKKANKPSSTRSPIRTKIAERSSKRQTTLQEIRDEVRPTRTRQTRSTGRSDGAVDAKESSEDVEESPLDQIEDIGAELEAPLSNESSTNDSHVVTNDTDATAKSRNNIRMTAGKRNFATKETEIEREEKPAKRPKLVKSVLSDVVASTEEPETNKEAIVASDDEPVKLNIKRKTRLRKR